MRIRTRLRRWVAVAGVLGVIAGMAAVVVPAGPAAAATGSCDWSDTTPGHLAGPITVSGVAAFGVTLPVNAGDTISYSCTGLGVNGLAIAQANPLSGIAPANISAALVNTAVLNLGFSGGSISGTFVLPPAGQLPASLSTGFQPTASDATCPPTQDQINAGLVSCSLAAATDLLGSRKQESVIPITYVGQGTPNDPPTLQITNEPSNGFVPGNTVTVADNPANPGPATAAGHYFWTAGVTGLGNGWTQAPAPAVPVIVLENGTPTAVHANLGVSAASYANATCTVTPSSASCTGAGTLTPPHLSGDFTWSDASPAPNPVTVSVVAPLAQSFNGTSFTVNATGNTTANQQSAGSSATNVSPASGNGSAGNTLTFDYTPWDAQGNIICQPVFTNGASIPATPPATSGDCPSFTGSTGTATIDPSGSIHVSIPITAADNTGDNTVYLVADPPGSPTNITVPYTISALAVTCTTAGSPSSCDTDQIISQDVTGTPIGLTQTEQATDGNTPPTVQMSPIALNGDEQTSSGVLNTDVVKDIRGSLVGWTVTAVFQDDLQGPLVGNHHVIPVSGFNWTPSVALHTPTSGYAGDVVAGPATVAGFDKSVAHGGTGTSRTLCTAAAGGGGGTFDCKANLTLVVPAGVAAGAGEHSYSAVLVITIT
jgi:hypothetical protein